MPGLTEAVRAAGFDLDGTLIDTAADLAAAANSMLAQLGMPTLPEADIPPFIGAGIERLILQALAASARRAPTPAEQTQGLALFRAHYARQLYARSRVYPGVEAGLRALAAAGMPLSCVTNKAAEFTGPLLDAAGLKPYFALVLTPGCEADRKPSPALLLAACAQLHIAPRELLYVGDSRADILAARAAGCRTVSVSYGYNSRDVLAQLNPDAIIASLADLSALQLPA